MTDKITVLFLAAYPDAKPLMLDEEIRAIKQKIRVAKYPNALELVSAWAVRPDDLLQELNEHDPHIVHFSGHGNPSGEIILVSENLVSGQRVSKPVSPEAIQTLFQAIKGRVRVVLLNACYSRIQAEALTKVVDCVIGMHSTISDQIAIKFAASFYRALGFGKSVKEAFDQGKAALILEGLSNEMIDLLCKPGIDPAQLLLIEGALKKGISVSENFLYQIWDILDSDLQDALALAYNQACREGQSIIKTRYLFAALARLRPEKLKALIDYIPQSILPPPIRQEVTAEKEALFRENPELSSCVEDSLRHLTARAGPQRKISTLDVFVDIAKYGTGSSVARLRQEGLTPATIDELIEQFELDIIKRE